jgi:hypothetical protein
MKKILIMILVGLIGAVLIGGAWAAVPQSINFQGKLAGVTGSKTFSFKIYDAATAGNLLWMNDIPVTLDPNGTFNIVIDISQGTFKSGTASANDIFSRSNTYLQVE